MRILLGYSYYKSVVDVKTSVVAWLGRLRAHGILVDGFCLTLDPPGPRLGWPELEDRWQRGDRKLLSMYESLARAIESYDVFVNYNGINLHPDFVRQLPAFTVYGCFDDPESSADLSQPVAWAYDLAMVGNIAELETYRQWGVKEVRHWPLGFRSDDFDPSLTREAILTGDRDIDVCILAERESPWRQERFDRFAAALPQGAYYGHGWPDGFLPEGQRILLMQRTKIGLNIHNSTGPINFRTFVLPANGVMQLCDNLSYLGRLFELNKEVVGFSTIGEAVDACRYYLAHDEERREIAAAGWERALRDYNELETFRLLMEYVEELCSSEDQEEKEAISLLSTHRRRTRFCRLCQVRQAVLRTIRRYAICIRRSLRRDP